MAAMSDAQPSKLNLWMDFLATNKVDETSAPVRVRLTVPAQDWTMHESASVEITARNSLRSQSAEVGQTDVSSGRPELLAVSMTAELRAAVPGTRRKPL